ncbi:TPR domain protein [Ichthyobacterium seriolicida]|uniref:TPR domain protein n=2 Tax=Ichthyobacterium seriolicida TaxID=242600 RepID=A0A1J1E407_9FLAO|nr:TPR domain protein [Ichthyobacterium seriolicida]
MVTYFNILFNAEKRYNKAINLLKEKEEKSKENIYGIFPLEEVGQYDSVFFSKNTDIKIELDSVINKTTKAIQEYSVMVNGAELNTQIPSSYLLLAKVNYLKSEYLSALEAFNYIIHNIRDSNTYTETKIWTFKCQNHLGNESIIEEDLKHMYLNSNKINNVDIKLDLYITYAQTLIKISKYRQAISVLEKAINLISDQNYKIKCILILSQLYAKLDEGKKISHYADQVIKADISPKMNILALISKLNGLDHEHRDNIKSIIYEMRKIMENDESSIYEGLIYYNIGYAYLKIRDTISAIKFFEKTVNSDTADKNTKVLSNAKLGDIYFDNAEYILAKQRYRECLDQAEKDWIETANISRKKSNLKNIVSYMLEIKRSDSILLLSSMPIDKLKSVIKKQVEDNRISKNKLILQKEKVEKETKTGDFYFYNSIQIDEGKEYFVEVWDNRRLQDNWRTINDRKNKVKNDLESIEKKTEEEKKRISDIEDSKTIDSLLNDYPKAREDIERIEQSRNTSLYKLGVVYKEVFKRDVLAKNTFIKLMNYKPAKNFEIPINYNLYKIYKDLGVSDSVSFYRDKVLKLGPNSRYAHLISNPLEKYEGKDTKMEIYSIYRDAYKKYTSKDYTSTIAICKNAVKDYPFSDISPKFELLKSYAFAKVSEISSYKDNLEFILFHHSKSEEAKKAKELLDNLSKYLKDKEDKKDSLNLGDLKK